MASPLPPTACRGTPSTMPIDWNHFTPVASLAGGLAIGLAAAACKPGHAKRAAAAAVRS